MMEAVLELPQFDSGQIPRERADAARNRRRILAAAAELVDERGIGRVSMDDVARAACVGTGTLYRRFGARSGHLYARGHAWAPGRSTGASGTAPGSRSRCSTSTRGSSRTG